MDKRFRKRNGRLPIVAIIFAAALVLLAGGAYVVFASDAILQPLPTCSLSADIEGQGAITVVDPAGGQQRQLDQVENQLSLACDRQVTLTAKPDALWRFVAWQGVPTESRARTTISVSASDHVTAVFEQRAIIKEPVETPYYNRAGELVTYVERLAPLPYETGSAAADLVAAAAPVIDIWYGNNQTFRAIGLPQEWINIVGNVSDLDGDLNLLSYRLNGGASRALAFGGDGSVADGRRLWNAGDFNIDIDKDLLQEGANQVTITAEDALGNQSTAQVAVNYTSANNWPLPYQVNWQAAPSIEDVAQIVDGKWALSAAGVRPIERGYDRLISLGQGPEGANGWTEFEVTAEVTVHGYDSSGFGPIQAAPAVGIVARWQGHTDTPIVCPQPKCGWLPVGASAWYEWDKDQSGSAGFSMWTHHASRVSDNSGLMLELDRKYIWKIRVDNSLTPRGRYYLKVWPAGDTEPADWLIIFDDSLDGRDQQSLTYGSILLLAHHTDVTFGNLQVQPLDSGAPDTLAQILLSADLGGTVGGVAYQDEDILAYNVASNTWSLFFDGSDVGLGGSNARDVDGFHQLADGSLLFSLLAASDIPGIGIVDDSDIIRFVPTSLGTVTAGSFELYFDGSDVGLDLNGEDVDGLAVLDNGDLLLSTIGSFATGTVAGADEDLARFTPTNTGSATNGSWSLYFDGSDVALGSADEDITAVWAEDDLGHIYLNTRGVFAVTGAAGDNADVLLCDPQSLGTTTRCSFDLFWDASANGLTSANVDALHLVFTSSGESTPTPPPPTSTPEPPGSAAQIFVSSTSGGDALGLAFQDEDILAFDTAAGTWTVYFDGSDVGLGDSSGEDVDAFDITADGHLLFSIAGPSTLSDVGAVDDSDIIEFIPSSTGANTAGSFVLYFDGSDVGLDADSEDIDAIALLDNGHVLVSTIGGWNTGTLSGNDKDLLRFLPTSLGSATSGAWSVYTDGSDIALDTADEDVTSVWNAAEGADLFFSVRTGFDLFGLTGDNADIIRCTNLVPGSSTSCTFQLFWDGSTHGYAGEIIDGLHIELAESGISPTPTSTPTNTPSSTATNTPTATPTSLATATPSSTPTNTPADTPTATATSTPVPSQTPTNTPVPATGRVQDGLVALYEFVQGPDASIIEDSSASPLDLQIVSGNTTWLSGGGLDVNSSAVIGSPNAAAKINSAAQAAGAITLEAWIKTDNLQQDGPARIVSISGSATERNVTLGQGRWGSQPKDLFDLRLRVNNNPEIDDNGQPSLPTDAGTAAVALQHVVMTYGGGQQIIYINGVQSASRPLNGDLSNWDASFPLYLANEASGDRPWLGTFYLVAFYGRALSQMEITQNFQAGVHGQTLPTATPTTAPVEPTATNTPSSSPTAIPDGCPDSSITEMVIFDWNQPVTEAERGFPNDTPPLAYANCNWWDPVNFAEGTFYLRVQVRGQPVAQEMRLQLCFWQQVGSNRYANEGCTRQATVMGTPGNVVTWSQDVQAIWYKPGNPIEWDRERYRYGVAVKNRNGEPVSDYNGWNWNGEDPTKWYPLDMRFTGVVVKKGSTFSGWNNY